MKIILFIFSTVLLISCNKKINTIDTIYYVEDYRKPGMDDYQTIMAALDSVPEFSKIIFSPKTYIFSHTPIVEKVFHFFGPSILKRENQVTYKLKNPADEYSTFLVLEDTKSLNVNDRFFVTFGQANKDNSQKNIVLKISTDTIFLYQPLGKTIDSVDYYPAGTSLFKNINFFWILSPNKYPDISCSFSNLTFDGNRDNNTGSYSWYLNSAVIALSKGTTFYDYCKFINSPAESIVGHNANIRNCSFYNLNGSGFHTSADKESSPEAEIHSYLTGNTFENTNQVSASIGGHSEGAITHSNSGGYYTATGNTFINVGESVLGALYPSNSSHDWGTSNISFTANTINGAGRMVYLIDTSRGGVIHDVKIEDNIISNLTGRDWSAELKYWPGIVIQR